MDRLNGATGLVSTANLRPHRVNPDPRAVGYRRRGNVAAFFLFGILAVVAIGLVRVAAYLVMPPVEMDASFRRAYPIIDRGRYLPEADLPSARSVLKAAAYTYVAASLFHVLNLLRILRAFR